MPINLERMKHRLAAQTTPALGGTPAGGMERPALSDPDRAARDLFVRWLEELRLAVRVDDFGTIYGRRSGRDPTAAPVLVGSHLDTVPRGGRFDGILGVVAALEVASALEEGGISTRRPIDVVNWTAEEGARFDVPMLASGGLARAFTREYVYDRTDRDGHRFGDELARIGYRGAEDARPRTIAASLELHIEQGPVLEQQGASVGIVEGIAAVRWCWVRVHGRGEHAGGTPVAQRRDAMVAAARMIVAARELARERGELKATTGVVTPEPGSINVVPELVTFSLDLRAREETLGDAALADISARFDAIAVEEGVSVAVEECWRVPPTTFDAAINDHAEQLCRERGYPFHRLVGTIGHDSAYLARVTRAAMLFTPTVDGLSHCPTEDSPWPDIERATDILFSLVVELANASD
ncbi:MAG: Zn-dependent hydrolase [Chloroflexi bacterium]|nr:Zn-dependent hydrolase [Chloroflexota bacterium]